ncbi:putative ISXO2-like transposase domain [Monocercomonoides exilis]|uniref:putative ISXO2-like transposase domain n=1 Tax=Monocercomonoides exilis TaxID=2049356 RepID=UPI0035598448|nr:putative ISXO2-like transposase domain [Monocercomonoides exilis]|eukprot:MONOS_9825.1-p1 / transcript=MONOS_9825.1 / gene=MONOS_9825 / organism=Monocercomonoides_exilis_PA203 / gene_product=unspecified product / transcript_product=unspecified product / location=Mono_scaffold00420:29499-30089(-) / protein_length=196 / sequence_SO=supercontig / SO=protein_coding / is_pseudo=false
MIERNVEGKKGKCLLLRVPNRKKNTLIPIIQANVIEGTMIYSDEWKAYQCLETLGYKHLTVCHKYNFRDPLTGTCTNLIEGTWSLLRKSFPRTGVKARFIDDFLMSFIGKRDENLTINEFLTHVFQYKPTNDINDEESESETEEDLTMEIDDDEKSDHKETSDDDVPVIEFEDNMDNDIDPFGAGDGSDASSFEDD